MLDSAKRPWNTQAILVNWTNRREMLVSGGSVREMKDFIRSSQLSAALHSTWQWLMFLSTVTIVAEKLQMKGWVTDSRGQQYGHDWGPRSHWNGLSTSSLIYRESQHLVYSVPVIDICLPRPQYLALTLNNTRINKDITRPLFDIWHLLTATQCKRPRMGESFQLYWGELTFSLQNLLKAVS